MAEIPMKSAAACDRDSVLNLNKITGSIKTSQTIASLNDADALRPSRSSPSYAAPARPKPTRPPGIPAPAMPQAQESSSQAFGQTGAEKRIPKLLNQIRKGQKVLLDPANTAHKIRVCLGWNTDEPLCDIDVSAFILDENGKVPGDDWFVFYGQESSPDKSVLFFSSADFDRQYIFADLARLNPLAKRIVFVLTINDAVANNLNFSMVKDAYVRILDDDTGRELVSFLMTDYCPNVISMMICEIYLHNGCWKCNAVGNGVARDLAGLCELYGVSII